MTINTFLYNAHYRGNQSLLANDLKVNRSTLKKYMTDIIGEFHFIKINSVGPMELFTNQSNKAEK